MPVYAYQCQSCGIIFTQAETLVDKRLNHCPECYQDLASRVAQLPEVILKGSRLYGADLRIPYGEIDLTYTRDDGPERSGG